MLAASFKLFLRTASLILRLLLLELPEDGSYTTIAGFLLARAGRLLDPGERVEDAAGIFQIERVDRRRISRVRFTPVHERKKSLSTMAPFVAFLSGSSLAPWITAT